MVEVMKEQAMGSWNDLASLVQEAHEGNLLAKPEVQACLFALGLDPQDGVAREMLDMQLDAFRVERLFVPNPFLPLPEPGEIDGTFRFACVEGHEE